MKKTLILLFIAISNICIGQTNDKESVEKFEYSEVGLNDFVVTNIDGKTKEEIYSKTINWVKETYKNPDLVLKMQIINEKLRIDAIANNLASINNGKTKFDLPYSIEISFKDNKYKFSILSLVVQNIKDLKTVPNFKTDKKIIKYWGSTSNDIENYFNKLNQSLKDYIIGKAAEKW